MKIPDRILYFFMILFSVHSGYTQNSFHFSGQETGLAAPLNAPFKLSCGDSLIMKIGLITDPQYCDCDPSDTRVYREALNKLPEAIDSMNKFMVDFVVSLGDMIDRYYESYDTIGKCYQQLNMPFYNVLGNHDFEEMHDTLKPNVVPRYGMPDFYYGFDHKNWRFLVLDGTELASYTRSLHPELAGEGDSLFLQVQDSVNNKPWNGGIGRAQRKWIREQIQSACDLRYHVILFCHFPLYPDSVDLNLWNHEEIMALIEDYPNVIAYINGHYHQGNYGFKKGIHYVTQAAMLDTWETNSFSVLEVYSDKLVFKGFGFNPDRILTYEDPYQDPLPVDPVYESFPRLYPNPVSDILLIDLGEPVDEGIELMIADMSGRPLKTKGYRFTDPTGGIIVVTLKPDIPPGIYWVRVSCSSRKNWSGKFIVRARGAL
jgi:hypothetical protein